MKKTYNKFGEVSLKNRRFNQVKTSRESSCGCKSCMDNKINDVIKLVASK